MTPLNCSHAVNALAGLLLFSSNNISNIVNSNNNLTASSQHYQRRLITGSRLSLAILIATRQEADCHNNPQITNWLSDTYALHTLPMIAVPTVLILSCEEEVDGANKDLKAVHTKNYSYNYNDK